MDRPPPPTVIPAEAGIQGWGGDGLPGKGAYLHLDNRKTLATGLARWVSVDESGYNRAMTERMTILAQGVQELGVLLSEDQLDQFQLYYSELSQWNQRVNLTSIIQYEEVQVKHFLDSLTLCLACQGGPAPGSRLIDVGAGPGLPGLAIKLAFPHVHLTLADSVGKKTAFLRHLVETLGLEDVEVITARAEELGQKPELRESFDLALARGLAKMPALLEYTLPFCKVGGKVVAWKHGGIAEEIASAREALRILGGRSWQAHPVEVTGLADNRILVVTEKVKPTPDQYPRRIGVPAKQPL